MKEYLTLFSLSGLTIGITVFTFVFLADRGMTYDQYKGLLSVLLSFVSLISKGVSIPLCKRPGFVFGMGFRGRVSLPLPIDVETLRVVMAQLSPRPACVPATES
jgi:hypothetical protein